MNIYYIKFEKPLHASSAGFTLVELLTVIAIVGVLVSFALPTYREYQQAQDREIIKVNMLRHNSTLLEQKSMNKKTKAFAGLSGYTHKTKRGFRGSYIWTSSWGNRNLWRIFASLPDDSECARLEISSAGLKKALDSNGNDNTEYCWNN